jgi:hypothetical protein
MTPSGHKPRRILRTEFVSLPKLAGEPKIPVVADFVPGYEASAWYGVAAPKNTPVEIKPIEREVPYDYGPR